MNVLQIATILFMNILVTHNINILPQRTCIIYIVSLTLKSQDFVSIDEGNREIKKLTGVINEEMVQSSHSDLKIHFKSDHEGKRMGFEIIIKYIGELIELLLKILS